MDFSLTKRKVSIGAKKNQEVFVAHPVCQKHHFWWTMWSHGGRFNRWSSWHCGSVLSFPQSVKRTLFERLHCRRGTNRYVPTHIHLKICVERRRFQAFGVHLPNADSLHSYTGVPPTQGHWVLPSSSTGEGERQEKTEREQEREWGVRTSSWLKTIQSRKTKATNTCPWLSVFMQYIIIVWQSCGTNLSKLRHIDSDYRHKG